MIWEFLATAFMGLFAAGIAFALRFAFRRTPKWIVPASAGLAMLIFTIYSEYHWYTHTASRLPSDVVVIHEVPSTALYKPWSYAKPQVLQFVALDKQSLHNISDTQKQAMLYFFERRMQAKPLPILIDCAQKKQRQQNGEWTDTAMTKHLIAEACV